jgi:hypothetical protein
MKGMREAWHEHIENGQREFRRRLDGVLLVIQPHVSDAWTCELPNGKRIIGRLLDVQRAAEIAFRKGEKLK